MASRPQLADLDFLGAGRVSGLLDPVSDGDAVTKRYVRDMDVSGVALSPYDFWTYDVVPGTGNYGPFTYSAGGGGTFAFSTVPTATADAPFGLILQSSASANSGGRLVASNSQKEFINSRPRKFIARFAFPVSDADVTCRIGMMDNANVGSVTNGVYLLMTGGVLTLVAHAGGAAVTLGTFSNPITTNTVYTIELDLNATEVGSLRAVLYDPALLVVGSYVGNILANLPSAAVSVGMTAFTSAAAIKDLLTIHAIGYGTYNGWQAWSRASREVKQVEVDFGTTPVRQKVFTIVDPRVTATSRVVASQSGEAPTGRYADDNELDQLHIVVTPTAGGFKLIATCQSGSVLGKYKINYQIG